LDENFVGENTNKDGKADAEAYILAVSAMGGDNFTQLKITESIDSQKNKVIPDILITGENNDQNGALSH
jgi:hypothetical protein